MSKLAAIIGRIFLGLLFIVSGLNKLMNVGATEQMITATGLPGGFAMVAGICELLAGICLAAGFMVRLVALLLAIFLALTILFFQNQFNDPAVGMAALQNLALIGGLLLAFAHSQMWSHYYAIRKEHSGVVTARDAQSRLHEAEERAHQAELRAARAEGLAEGRGTNGHTVVTDADHDGVAEVHSPRRRRWFDW